jgi:small subunit ribosomal protein S29
MTGPPKKGGKTLKLTRSIRAKDVRPPAPGERKAIRKRIVLSNTNALEVSGLQELSKENSTDEVIRSKVMALPDELVDSLRAVEAFKVNQGWSFFKKPATLIREEAFEMSRLMDEIAVKTPDKRLEGNGAENQRGRTIRRIIYGERAAGKSVLLLQAMSMAFLKGWVVINIPEGIQNWFILIGDKY